MSIVDNSLEASTEIDLNADERPVSDEPTSDTEQEQVVAADGDGFQFLDDIQELYGESGTVTQDQPILLELPDNRKFDPEHETLSLPALPTSIALKYAENFPNLNISETEEGRDWQESYRASTFYSHANDRFLNRLKKPGSKFAQSIEFEGKKLGAGAVNLKSNPADKLTGEKAVYWVKTVTGQGGIVQIPLWHSGFWISIKTPSEIALLELNARLSEEKVELGRQSYGLAFSNATVFFTGHITNFILDHVFDHSVKDIKDIRSLIVCQDIHLLAWGIACAIWKNGFQYTRSIVNEDNTVGKVIKALLAVPRMCFTDRSALTDWQKSHMAGRHGKNMTVDAIERYRKEFSIGHTRTITVDTEKDIKVELSVPYLDQYLSSGEKWVNYLVMKVDDAMRLTSEDNRRSAYIQQYGRASLLRQYSHWVKSISVQGRVFDDVDTVELLLDDLSSDDSVREIYFTEIGKFMDDTTVSIVAVPAVVGTDPVDKSPRFPYLVPIDPLMTFFTLLVQKVNRIQVRK